jgi:molybdopterin-biosynthesis enzyme MoeA-like protein
MLDAAAQDLETGIKMKVETIEALNIAEGAYGQALGDIAARFPSVSIGSYPSMVDGVFKNQIVVRSKDMDALMDAKAEVEAMLAQLQSQRP